MNGLEVALTSLELWGCLQVILKDRKSHFPGQSLLLPVAVSIPLGVWVTSTHQVKRQGGLNTVTLRSWGQGVYVDITLVAFRPCVFYSFFIPAKIEGISICTKLLKEELSLFFSPTLIIVGLSMLLKPHIGKKHQGPNVALSLYNDKGAIHGNSLPGMDTFGPARISKTA